MGSFVTVAFFAMAMGVSGRGPDRAADRATDRGLHAAAEAQPASGGSASRPELSQAATAGSAANAAPSDNQGKQIAIATLIASVHEIDRSKVVFYAEPGRSGNALQQFAEVFGEAISTGRSPRPIRAPLRQPKGGV
ncbi:MAG: hypothetical protein AAFR96_05865 [Planctomycetota bacterium]